MTFKVGDRVKTRGVGLQGTVERIPVKRRWVVIRWDVTGSSRYVEVVNIIKVPEILDGDMPEDKGWTPCGS